MLLTPAPAVCVCPPRTPASSVASTYAHLHSAVNPHRVHADERSKRLRLRRHLGAVAENLYANNGAARLGDGEGRAKVPRRRGWTGQLGVARTWQELGREGAGRQKVAGWQGGGVARDEKVAGNEKMAWNQKEARWRGIRRRRGGRGKGGRNTEVGGKGAEYGGRGKRGRKGEAGL
eukprot:225029-Chlamydomonas_euryale.AAC.1